MCHVKHDETGGITLPDLLDAARAARAHAYAPYSHFAVGAAILASDGEYYSGCNVENASYGLTICAERVALFHAIAEGAGGFTAIAVAGPPGVTTPPCGACRQVLAEFGAGLTVCYDTADGPVVTTIDELLPRRFSLGE